MLQQYWAQKEPYQYVTPAAMREAFQQSQLGQQAAAHLAQSPERTEQGATRTFPIRGLPVRNASPSAHSNFQHRVQWWRMSRVALCGLC